MLWPALLMKASRDLLLWIDSLPRARTDSMVSRTLPNPNLPRIILGVRILPSSNEFDILYDPARVGQDNCPEN